MNEKWSIFLLGVITALGVGYFLGAWSFPHYHWFDDHHVHGVDDDHHHDDDEVHVHSDFLVYIDGEKLDLSDERYMSSVGNVHHNDIHLHDGNGHVIHRHAEGITLRDFFDSLGFDLTASCITTPTGDRYCTNETSTLQLYVNKQAVDTIVTYIPQEEDQLLLYYGDPSSPEVDTLLESITDESCIYSGTCPERGTAPAESCGLTCEVSS